MPRAEWRRTDGVRVPDVVGTLVCEARRVANEAGRRRELLVITWSALDRGDPAGVREPRRPRPPLGPAAAERPLPPE